MQVQLIKIIRKIKIALIFIVVGAVIIGSFFNNNTIAYYDDETHNMQIVDYVKTEFYMSHITRSICSECNYKTIKTERCNLVNYKKIDENKHQCECELCGDKYILSHVDANQNGICDECSATIKPDASKTHICLENSEYKCIVFDDTYHDYYALCNLCENPVLDWQKREEHDFSKYTSGGDKYHIRVCKKCGYEIMQSHEGGNHSNDGKCIVCGYQYKIHKKTTILAGYTDITEDTHLKLYKCSYEGCTETFTGNVESHYYQNGQCVCGYKEPEKEVEIKLSSKNYIIQDSYILNIQPETLIKEFENNISTNATEKNIYNLENNLLGNNDIVGTGMKLKLKNGDKTQELTLIIKGDVNGDGQSDINDILKINQERLNKKTFESANNLAADITNDKTIDLKDIIKINMFRLNKISEL